MKKIYFLFAALFAATLLFACENPAQDDPTPSSGSLLGKWELVEKLILKNGEWINDPKFIYQAGSNTMDFASKTVTAIDPNNPKGIVTEYVYDPTTALLSLFGGLVTHKVLKITNNELIFGSPYNNIYEKYTLKKLN